MVGGEFYTIYCALKGAAVNRERKRIHDPIRSTGKAGRAGIESRESP